MADCTTTQSSCSSRRFCPHCSESLSLKTFKTHKRLYYDEDADIVLLHKLAPESEMPLL